MTLSLVKLLVQFFRGRPSGKILTWEILIPLLGKDGKGIVYSI